MREEILNNASERSINNESRGDGHAKSSVIGKSTGVRLRLGSLFDGIGGFPLSAVRNGILPVWASEIEPFPIQVTRQRFPEMLHVGDITKLKGADLPAVDIITGGSPCQDLSIAGKRAGLSGE